MNAPSLPAPGGVRAAPATEPVAPGRRDRGRDGVEPELARAIEEADRQLARRRQPERDEPGRAVPQEQVPLARDAPPTPAPASPRGIDDRVVVDEVAGRDVGRAKARERGAARRADEPAHHGHGAGRPTEQAKRQPQRTHEQPPPANAGPTAKRGAAGQRPRAGAGPSVSEEDAARHARPGANIGAQPQTARVRRRDDAPAGLDGAGAAAGPRGTTLLGLATEVAPVTRARAALFDAEQLLHGSLAAESARVTVDVGGEALHLFVRVHEHAAEVRASGAVPEELERGLRASLLGEGMRLDHFSTGGGERQPGAGADEQDDGGAARKPVGGTPATAEGGRAGGTPGGVKVSVRA